jgi:PKD repeat protein
MKKLLLLSSFLIAFTSCNLDTVAPKSKACFDFSPNSNVTKNTEISFSNCSKSAVSFIWSFGDGNISTDKEPKHIFVSAGTYKVLLMTQNGEVEDYNGDGLIDWHDGNATSDTISKIIVIGN